MTNIERAALIGVGLWLGIAVGRTEFEPAALPVYAIAAVLLIAARLTVSRYRDRKSLRHADQNVP